MCHPARVLYAHYISTHFTPLSPPSGAAALLCQRHLFFLQVGDLLVATDCVNYDMDCRNFTLPWDPNYRHVLGELPFTGGLKVRCLNNAALMRRRLFSMGRDRFLWLASMVQSSSLISHTYAFNF